MWPSSARKNEKTRYHSGLDRRSRFRPASDEFGEASAARKPKHAMDSRTAQVGINKQDFPTRLRDRHGEIGNQCRLAIAHIRAGHLDDFVIVPMSTKENCSADA